MPKSLVDFSTRQRVDPDWIVPGLLKRKNTAFMIGPPKRSGKSWLLLEMGWNLSVGEAIWGVKKANGDPLFLPKRPMRTVYFAQEDTEDDVYDRVMPSINLGRTPNDMFWIVPKNWAIQMDTLEGRRLMQDELEHVRHTAGPIDLVMLDPMRRLHKREENDSTAIAEIWDVLGRIQEKYACATLFAHHTKKPPDDRTNYDPTSPFVARGSGDIYGGGDGFMTIVPKRQTEAFQTVEMHFESKRGRPLPPIVLKINFPMPDSVVFGEGVKVPVEYLGRGWDRTQPAEEDRTIQNI